jgi:hypothetical protein
MGELAWKAPPPAPSAWVAWNCVSSSAISKVENIARIERNDPMRRVTGSPGRIGFRVLEWKLHDHVSNQRSVLSMDFF